MDKDVLAVYPGTFDPITLGHEDVVRRATQLFGRVIVAVAAGHHKSTLFSVEERLDMVRESVKEYPQVQVESFAGLLRDFVVERGGKAPSDRYQFISSSFVREIATLGGEVEKFVSPMVLERLMRKVATPAA